MLRTLKFATALLTVATLGGRGGSAVARCFDDAGDVGQIRSARTTVDASCRCFTYDGQPGKRQGDYVRCVSAAVSSGVATALLRPDCAGTVLRMYRQSICGRTRSVVPQSGPAVPCVSGTRSGAARCAIRPARVCIARGAHACFGSTSCVDAADTDGDLRVGPGDSAGCTPGSTYRDNGDGTITDTQLGLVWERKGDDDAIHDWYTWSDASTVHVAALNAAGRGGYSDWRLPTIAELQTLVRPGAPTAVAPEFDAGCVPGVPPRRAAARSAAAPTGRRRRSPTTPSSRGTRSATVISTGTTSGSIGTSAPCASVRE